MTVFEPIIDEQAIIAYIAQTFTGWHWGVARQEYAREWLDASEPLSDTELAAIAFLRRELEAGGEGHGCSILAKLFKGEDAGPGIGEALESLRNRAVGVLEAARPALGMWRECLVSPPAWVSEMLNCLDNFFGLKEQAAVPVYLLPSARGWSGGNGDMYVEPGATTLECTGIDPSDPMGLKNVFTSLLHETIHSLYQRRFLIPVLEFELTQRRKLQTDYVSTPIAAMNVSLRDIIGEMLAHSFIPNGILPEFFGLEGEGSAAPHWSKVRQEGLEMLCRATSEDDIYQAWVMGASAAMYPVTKDYLANSKGFDSAWVRQALDEVESLCNHWKAGCGIK